MQERLQKIISRAGISSRRAGEELILAGRVRVNGQVVTELGAKADAYADTIEVDGRRLVPEAAHYLVLHKPRNVVSTLSDPEGRPTVAELIRSAGTRLYPVGRLDFATSGVLLVTNDGDFANGLLHPRGGVPKTYVLKVKGVMAADDLDRWAQGVVLEDGKTQPAEVRFLRHEDDKTWFEITIREGRNQQIRRMGEATGFLVMRLARLSFAGITSEGLRPGAYRSLTVDELMDLRTKYGVPKRIRGAALREHGEAGDRRPRSVERGQASAAAVAATPRPARGERAVRGERGERAVRSEGPGEAPRGRAPTPRPRAASPAGRSEAPRGRTAAARGRAEAPPRERPAEAPRGRTSAARGRPEVPSRERPAEAPRGARGERRSAAPEGRGRSAKPAPRRR